MGITHNLLYKTWADRPGVYIGTLYLKCKEEEMKNEREINTKNFYKNNSKYTYVCIILHRDCDLLQ
jgi:hypothetical protein